jgi:hypothetical protein
VEHLVDAVLALPALAAKDLLLASLEVVLGLGASGGVATLLPNLGEGLREVGEQKGQLSIEARTHDEGSRDASEWERWGARDGGERRALALSAVGSLPLALALSSLLVSSSWSTSVGQRAGRTGRLTAAKVRFRLTSSGSSSSSSSSAGASFSSLSSDSSEDSSLVSTAFSSAEALLVER